MRYVVYGSGAVGGVIGGRLSLAETPTTLVARGPHLLRLQEHGLTLDTERGVRTIRSRAVGSAQEVPWTDDTVVLLTVKSHQTSAALHDLDTHAPADLAVVSAQNGVSNELAILRHFARTYSICVMLPAAHVEPGVVVQQCSPTPGILDMGRFPNGVDGLVRAVRADLTGAGFDSQPREDIMAWKYRKLITNLANGVMATCRPGIASDELMRRAREEGERAIGAAGIPMVTAEEDATRRGDILIGRRRSSATRGGSTWQSLARGTGSTEIDYLAGEVVLLGRLYGVPTPVNEAVQRSTRLLARDRRPAGSLDAAELLASIR